jgi:hypothetical protein
VSIARAGTRSCDAAKSGRLIIRADNEGRNNYTGIDLLDLVEGLSLGRWSVLLLEYDEANESIKADI